MIICGYLILRGKQQKEKTKTHPKVNFLPISQMVGTKNLKNQPRCSKKYFQRNGDFFKKKNRLISRVIIASNVIFFDC